MTTDSAAPPSGASRRTPAALVAASIVLVAGLVWAGGAAWGGRFLEDLSPGRDIYHLSTIYERWARHVLGGHVPLWLPEFQGGTPLPAAGMYGLSYPGHLLFGLLRAETAWTWAVLLHAAFAAAGACRLVQSETRDRVAGISAGIIFGACEFIAGRALCGHLNVLAPLAWAPWVFHFLACAARGTRGAGVLAGVCAAAGLLAGHVQVSFYLAPLAVAFAVMRCVRASDRSAALRETGIAAVVAVALSAVQWLATIEFVAVAGRSPVTGAEIAGTSAPLAVLVAKLFPGFLGASPPDAWGPAPWQHEFTGIAGLFLVPLVAAAFVVRRRVQAVDVTRDGGIDGVGDGPRAASPWFWAVLAVAGLILAPGVENGLSALLNRIPPIAWGRTPGRALLLTALGVSVLAGFGVAAWRAAAAESADALHRLAVRSGVATAAAGVVGLGVLALLLRAHGLDTHAATATRAVVVAVFGAAIVLAVLVIQRRVGRPDAAVVAGVLVAAALAAPVAGTIPAAFYHSEWTLALPADTAGGRVHLLDERMPNVERLGVRTLREVCYVDTPWQRAFLRGAKAERARWLDVRAELAGIDPARFTAPDVGPGDVRGRPIQGIGAGLVFARATTPISDAEALETLDRGAVVALLADRSDETDADRAGIRAGAPTSALPRRVHAVPSPDPDVLRVRVDAGPAGWLVLSERWFPGWTATVDGAAAPLVRMNVALRAVRVPDRACDVEMAYRPPFAIAGRVVSAAAAVAVVAAIVAGGLRARRK